MRDTLRGGLGTYPGSGVGGHSIWWEAEVSRVGRGCGDDVIRKMLKRLGDVSRCEGKQWYGGG